MAKLIGYIIAVVGLIVAVVSFNLSKISFIPEAVKSGYVMTVGIILVIVGVVFSLSRGKSSQAEEEVPIYQGKKIIGYRKQK